MTRLPLVVECVAPARMRAPSRRAMARWASAALGPRGLGKELALKLVSQPQMRALNRQFRGKDKPTNVLAFPAMHAPGATRAHVDSPLPLGDVVICPAVLRREAHAQGKTLQAHWAHLVVHGALHLAGFDHEQERDAQRMERREIAVLRSLGFDNPYRMGPHV